MRKRWKKCVACLLAGMMAFTGAAGVFSVRAQDKGNVKAFAGNAETGAGVIHAGAGAAKPAALSAAADTQSGAEMNSDTGIQSETGSTADGSTGGTGAADSGASAGTQSETGSKAADTQSGTEMNNDAGVQPETGGTADGSTGGTGTDGGETGAGTDGGSAGTDGEDSEVTASDQDAGETDSDHTVRADIEKNPEISADITIEDEDDDNVVITENDKPYLALGANLNEEQKKIVLSLMGIDAANLEQYNVVTVTNDEEHQYLDGYLDASTIGSRALSSVVIVKRDRGEGIHISTKNINYCTVGMYKNALATAGLEDADVIVAGPFPLSGTAALIGAMKAYADMEDKDIDAESLDAAMNEIVVTGELNESLGDDVETEEFIAYVKQKVVEGGLQNKEKIQKVITDACKKFEISLSDDEKAQITALMEKIGSLDIDIDSLMKQAGSIYDSLKEMDGAGGFFSSILAFFKRLFEAVIEFFKGLAG